MVRKILGSLSAILSDAQERGLVLQNVVRGLHSRRRRGKDRRADKRNVASSKSERTSHPRKRSGPSLPISMAGGGRCS